MYTITRQAQWPNGTLVVEISAGGLDYCNPDALSAKYDGEFETFENPVTAVETAIEIAKQWQKDSGQKIEIAYGSTGGMTMPFEPSDIDDIRQWAEQKLEVLEKCPVCGTIVEDMKEWYVAGIFFKNEFFPYDDGVKYCSEYCAEQHSEFDNEED